MSEGLDPHPLAEWRVLYQWTDNGEPVVLTPANKSFIGHRPLSWVRFRNWTKDKSWGIKPLDGSARLAGLHRSLKNDYPCAGNSVARSCKKSNPPSCCAKRDISLRRSTQVRPLVFFSLPLWNTSCFHTHTYTMHQGFLFNACVILRWM